MYLNVRQVIEENRARIEAMRELNTRAGEDLFRVPTTEELDEFLKDKLGGARCAAEIKDFSLLLLPEADAEIAGLIRKENPDTVALLGKQVIVSYEAGQPPTADLNLNDFANHEWLHLPDSGIKLPGGKQVRVRIVLGILGVTIEETDLAALKLKLLHYLNEEVWRNWNKPVEELPDFSRIGVDFPNIIERMFGRCTVTNQPLLAYGTLVYNPNRIASDCIYFFQWFRDKQEALSAHFEARALLNSVRRRMLLATEIREQEQRKEEERRNAQQEALQVKKRIVQLYAAQYNDLKDPLRSELYKKHSSDIPYLLNELVAWTQEARHIIERVEKSIANAERKKAALLDQTVQARLILACRVIGGGAQEDFVYRVYAFVEQAAQIAGGLQNAYNLLRLEHEKEVYGREKRKKSILGKFSGIDLQDLDWMPGKDIVAVLKWLEKQLIDSGVELTSPLFLSPKVPAEKIDLTKLFERFGKLKK